MGRFWGEEPPPPQNGQSHCAKCCAAVPIYVEVLIYIAKRLVVVVVSSVQVVKPLSRLAMVHSDLLGVPAI